ncbi:MAG TPA: pitrilysin family protein [Anaeromyxobacteraceae bacterium]|nr:pitrilysin family protein [Anaeromyxobacteraceae bacterium]
MTTIGITGRAAAAALALAAAAHPGLAGAGPGQFDERKTTPAQLDLAVERTTLPNGLTLVLAPDARGTSVAVWTSFRAGAVFEPPGRAGLAHLAEHVFASGPTPETDYATLLETRRARHFNASTGHDVMTFEAVVPAEELAAALWVAADRLGTLPALVDAPLVARHRRVVEQERAVRVMDAPYGQVQEQLAARLFAAPHPLHAGVVGSLAELAAITPEDVRAFAATYLVPSNAVVVVAGRFDPAEARRLVEEGLGRLPAGRRVPAPRLPSPDGGYVDRRAEPFAREPRVTLAWRFPDLSHDDGLALQMGARLLSFMTDGAFGMRVAAGLEEYGGESIFRLDVTVPYDESMLSMENDAEALLRFLTHREMPVELIRAAHLSLDRSALLALDDVAGRAELLTHLEHLPPPRLPVARHLGWHWQLDRLALRDVARIHLRQPKVVMHARPVRPKAARAERE